MSQPTAQPATSDADTGLQQPQKPSLLVRLYRVVRHGRLLGAVKRRLKPMVIRLGKSAMKRPFFKQLVLKGLNHAPGLKVRLHRILWSEVNLSPRSLRIYTELKAAVAAQANKKTESRL